MDTDVAHLTADELTAGLEEVRRSPTDAGTLEMIVQRPAVDERAVLTEGRLRAAEGLEGDTWNVRGSKRTDDGSSHPDMQLNIINVRLLRHIARGDEARMPLAGDQLVVDLDLSEENLPPWTKLSIGEAVIEITDQPHLGCAKFSQRFGVAAHRFVNSEVGRELHLRGVNARVVQEGTIRPGDRIDKL